METLLGRRRSIPELQSRNAQLRSAGERMAINMPIQGTAADIMKIALIRLHERLAAERSPARMLLSVHDEVLLEVPRAEVAGLAPVVREVMEGALQARRAARRGRQGGHATGNRCARWSAA